MTKWMRGNPEREGMYLTTLIYGDTNSRIYQVLDWCDGWNCYKESSGEVFREYEIKDVDAYAVIDPPEEE